MSGVNRDFCAVDNCGFFATVVRKHAHCTPSTGRACFSPLLLLYISTYVVLQPFLCACGADVRVSGSAYDALVFT